MVSIIGWDIGGANIKAAWVSQERGLAAQVRVESRPFEIWREKDRLPEVLQEIYRCLTWGVPPQALAMTMTAELSDVFKTKREGVLFVLDCIKMSFPDQSIRVLSLSGDFVSVNEAHSRPLDFAATNWVATVQWIAREFPNCLLIDVGSTTTDILPILNGKACVSGRTDPERLSSGELVFTGALRTNLAAIVQTVPIGSRVYRVASEYFAISGDVHLILGHLMPQEYTCTTPDCQAPSVESARRRLARLVCADTEILSPAEIDEMALYICQQQIRQIREGLEQVLSTSPVHRKHPAVLLGIGAFLGSAAAESIGLDIARLEGNWGKEKLAVAPCLAAAHLLAENLEADLQ
jgi:(4-(4-[2-(gamma-L-glutamylamino)ethyl]phenoxymethyl)furan-2-yl)methanamine synthase